MSHHDQCALRKGARGRRRRLVPLVLAVVGLAAVGAGPAAAQQSAAAHWVGTWAASPQIPAATGPSSTGFTDQTVRQTIHTSVGGSQVRVRLSNTFGKAPLTVGEVALATAVGPGRIESSTSTDATFFGGRSVTIPPGAEVMSDPVAMRVSPDSDVAVTMYFSAATGPVTWHSTARETTYVSGPGNHVTDASTGAFPTTATSWFVVDGLDVTAAPRLGALVALGDSITDGTASTVDANHRYPNFLARRLLAQPAGQREAVLDEGISGNRVLSDTATHVNVLARFDRDVIAQHGVRDVLLLEGINDIGNSELTTPVTPAQLEAVYEQLIAQAHLAGLRILAATILPYQGAGYSGPIGEVTRQTVNDWIRTRSDFDGVVDFDRVMRDPANPTHMLPAYDSGDHLHPNDAGYAAMAASVRLSCLSLADRTPALTGTREDCTESSSLSPAAAARAARLAARASD